MKQGNSQQYQQFKREQAINQPSKPSDWQRIHVSPVDERHMIEVWENAITKERYYLPHYSRTGRSWAPYKRNGQRLAAKSYGSAKHIIDNAERNTRARRGA